MIPRRLVLPSGADAVSLRGIGDPTVLAVDPGGTTGWAVLTVHPDVFIYPDCRILHNIEFKQAGQIYGAGEDDDDEMAAVRELLLLISHWPNAVIVLEDFKVLRPSRDTEYFSPMRINNRVTWALWEKSWPRPVMQMSSMKLDDRVMQAAGMWNPDWIPGVHARDAVNHALVLLRRAKSKPAYARQLGWRTEE